MTVTFRQHKNYAEPSATMTTPPKQPGRLRLPLEIKEQICYDCITNVTNEPSQGFPAAPGTEESNRRIASLVAANATFLAPMSEPLLHLTTIYCQRLNVMLDKVQASFVKFEEDSSGQQCTEEQWKQIDSLLDGLLADAKLELERQRMEVVRALAWHEMTRQLTSKRGRLLAVRSR